MKGAATSAKGAMSLTINSNGSGTGEFEEATGLMVNFTLKTVQKMAAQGQTINMTMHQTVKRKL